MSIRASVLTLLLQFNSRRGLFVVFALFVYIAFWAAESAIDSDRQLRSVAAGKSHSQQEIPRSAR